MPSNNSSLPAVPMAMFIDNSSDSQRFLKAQQEAAHLDHNELDLAAAMAEKKRTEVEKNARMRRIQQHSDTLAAMSREDQATSLREAHERRYETEAKKAKRGEMKRERDAAERKARKEALKKKMMASKAREAALLPAKVGEPISLKGMFSSPSFTYNTH
jgi:hypothetical protein